MKNTGYLVQAALVAIWWISLLIVDGFYKYFQLEGMSKELFYGFAIPDTILIIGLSVWASYSANEKLKYIILGAFAFGALFMVGASLITQSGYLGTLLMLLGLGYNMFLTFSRVTFLTTRTSNFWFNSTKTFLQIICVWSLSLVVLPFVIHELVGRPFLIARGAVCIVGGLLFISFSWLGLISAYYMVKYGKGTPLPMDQTQQLVVRGPYKFVRNPMAVAGVGQVFSMALLTTSYLILVYGILGVIIWHYGVRPYEEQDMELRFGKPYVKYKKEVKCWLPNLNQG